MKASVFAFVAGIIFAIGLSVSGMTNPSKVIGFLDLFGDFDPSLAFVMVGALVFNIAFLFFIKKKATVQVFLEQMSAKQAIDRPLVLGSALFGLGWGLLGICPGPALVNLVSGHQNAILFVASMLLGMMVFKWTSST